MFSIAVILKEESCRSTRTIAYETLKKENFVIDQQEHQIEKSKTVKHMALPVVTFNFVQSFGFEKASLKETQYTLEFVAGYTREFIFESNVMGDHEFSLISMFKRYLSMIIKKIFGRTWNSLKTFEKKTQLLLKVQIQQPSITKLQYRLQR